MITIQTAQFTGLLTDICPFAFPKDDMPSVNVVRLEWDGEMLHASATDMLRMARSSWHPDDDERGSVSKKPLFPAYGGDDDRWVVYMRLDDAKKLVEHFKLPAKEGAAPLTLDHREGKLRVVRSADTGLQAVTVIVETHLVDFPDVSKALDHIMVPDPIPALPLIGRHAADFFSVRQRGDMKLVFHGLDLPVRVVIGSRFVGQFRPDTTGRPRMAVVANHTREDEDVMV